MTGPQKGGLERRHNLIQILRDRGWDVVSVDVGDVAQMEGPAGLPNVQGPLKYVKLMEGLKAMRYTAVGIGESEAIRTAIIQMARIADSLERLSFSLQIKPPVEGEGKETGRIFSSLNR